MHPADLQRVSVNDLMELATDTPSAPRHVAAMLRLDHGLDPEVVVDLLADRVSAVPRLRQRLMRSPLGGGRPVWIDDANFGMSRHLKVRACPAPGDDVALLTVAATEAVAPLPRDRPLWSITIVTGLAGGGAALVPVLHHVLADGIGGVAVLASLMDGSPTPSGDPFPRHAPSAAALRYDAARSRMRALAALPRATRRGMAAALKLRPVHSRPPTACSLNQPVGPRRRLTVATVPLAGLRDAARRHEATINDVLLTAVAGALAPVVHNRGETVDSFVISVPASARRETTAAALGNQVGVIPVQVPARGGTVDRLIAVSAQTRTARGASRPGISAHALSAVFLLLARLGVFSRFVNHQRLVTTFVTNLRGPQTPLWFQGVRVSQIVPISSIAGNVTVAFAAFSYCGTLTVTVIADPDHCPDQGRITSALQVELERLAHHASADDLADPRPRSGAGERDKAPYEGRRR